jgi:hypothetical protein
VREAAGERWGEIEIHVNANLVDVSDGTSAAALEAAAQRTGQTVAQVRESPGTLVGSIEGIVEQLHARRAQFGISYYVVHGRAMDAFAPVVARLTS